MKTIPVPLPEGRAHEIHIGGPLQNLGRALARVVTGRRALVVSAKPVAARYAAPLQKGLKGAGFACRLALVPDGERHKTLASLARIYKEAVSAGLDRRSPIIALGGGVIGDMTGFAAASYMRGLPFVQVPTTLLAMVDASIGGKTAVDLPEGKNMVGAFWQPKLVWIDLAVLKSLPDRQWRTGLAEVIKYGYLGHGEIIRRLRGLDLAAVRRDPKLQQWLVERSVVAKVDVVARDERETKGLREILNLGHTFGHAVETVTGYKVYTHGEAIAIGMCAAARAAQKLGMLTAEEAAETAETLAAFGLPVRAKKRLPQGKILAAMARDKKNIGGELRLVLPDGTKRVKVVKAGADLVKEVLREVGI